VLRLSNGIDSVGLGTAAQIGPPERKELQPEDSLETLDVYLDAEPEPVHVPLARAQQWLRLSASGDAAATFLFYDGDQAPAVAGHRVIDLSEGAGRAYIDLRALLETRWAERQSGAQAQQRMTMATQAARERLGAASIAQLLAVFPQPTLFARLVLHEPGLPAPATQAQIAAAEHRMRRPLPADLAEFYRLHDGLRMPLLLPLERVEAVGGAASEPSIKAALDEQEQYPFTTFDAALHETGKLRLTASDVEACLVFGGLLHEGRRSITTALWCPPHAESPERWIMLRTRAVYPTFRAWLLDQAALKDAFDGQI
jgi:hypothetical protein